VPMRFFTAALLHDIGKMVLGNYVLKDLEKIKDMVAKGISFDASRKHRAGDEPRGYRRPDSPELVPAPGAGQCGELAHDPDSCEKHCVLSDVVHIANVIGRRIGYGKGLQRPRLRSPHLRSSNVSGSPRATSTNCPSRPGWR